MLKRMLAIDADKSAVQDKATRQKIDEFPPEIHDPDLLSKIKGSQNLLVVFLFAMKPRLMCFPPTHMRTH